MAVFELRLQCQNCGKDCRATISDATKSARFRCSACGQTLLEARAIKGYVYVLSHPQMPGLIKVGHTSRPVAQAVEELNRVSGLPEHFVIEASVESSSPDLHTAEIHRLLAARVIQGMEYFEAELPAVLRVVEEVVKSGPVREAGRPAPSASASGAPSTRPIGQWSCGLCKHKWAVATPPTRCPLCQSAAVVCLGEVSQTLNPLPR